MSCHRLVCCRQAAGARLARWRQQLHVTALVAVRSAEVVMMNALHWWFDSTLTACEWAVSGLSLSSTVKSRRGSRAWQCHRGMLDKHTLASIIYDTPASAALNCLWPSDDTYMLLLLHIHTQAAE
jgi:hypothetical protein